MQPYSYTMQFANRLPFSQHLVPRYSESLAASRETAKKFRPPNSAPRFRHWWLEKERRQFIQRIYGRALECSSIYQSLSLFAAPLAARKNSLLTSRVKCRKIHGRFRSFTRRTLKQTNRARQYESIQACDVYFFTKPISIEWKDMRPQLSCESQLLDNRTIIVHWNGRTAGHVWQ